MRQLRRLPAADEPTLDSLEQMPYTEACLKESLRLYPSAAVGSRECQQDCILGGYHVRKGTYLKCAWLCSDMSDLRMNWWHAACLQSKAGRQVMQARTTAAGTTAGHARPAPDLQPRQQAARVLNLADVSSCAHTGLWLRRCSFWTLQRDPALWHDAEVCACCALISALQHLVHAK